VTLPPWDYLFTTFNDVLFPDLFNAIWISSLVGILAMVILYNVRTRQLRRHQPYLDLYEWLLWTSITIFFLLLVYAVFHFDFIFAAVTIPIGLGVLAWVRFVRFPPELARYQQQLAKARFYSKQKFAHPESTIRPKRARRRRG
jgi:ABC-type Na+ efflux pump permease subunit